MNFLFIFAFVSSSTETVFDRQCSTFPNVVNISFFSATRKQWRKRATEKKEREKERKRKRERGIKKGQVDVALNAADLISAVTHFSLPLFLYIPASPSRNLNEVDIMPLRVSTDRLAPFIFIRGHTPRTVQPLPRFWFSFEFSSVIRIFY